MLASASRLGPFVGREDEFAALQHCWHEATKSRGGFALLSGEAGIGKTRLAEEFAASVAEAGGHVVWGRCYEGEGAPAFWPWIQAVTTLSNHDTGKAVFDSAPEIVHLLTPLLTGVGSSRPSGRFLGAETSGDYDRFRMFTACDQLLTRVSQSNPLLLVIEDLHWADQASLMIAEFLARQGNLSSSAVLVVATYRDAEAESGSPLGTTLGKIAGGCLRDRVALVGLSVDDVGRLIETSNAAAGHDAAALFAQTDGNPLFLHETLSLLASPGRAGSDGVLPLPAGIEQTIALRLGGLSAACREALSAAAVVGRDFTLVTLASLTGMTVDAVLEAIDEAERARVIREHETPGQFRFAHNLVRESLYRSLGSGARMRLHQKAGQAIERTHANELGPHYAELAHHFHQSSPLGEAARAMRYYRLQADRSMGQLAYEAAVEGANTAIRLHDAGESRDPVELGTALVTLGSALFRVGQREPARATFRRAVGAARELIALKVPEGAGLICGAALAFTGQELGYGASDPEGIDLLTEALSVVPGDQPATRLRIMASLGAWIHFAGRQPEAEVLLNAALEQSASLADSGTRSHVLNSWHATLRNVGNLPTRLRVTTELRDIGIATGDPEATIFGHRRRVMDFAEMGDGAAMEAEILAHDTLAARVRQPIHTWHTALWKAMAALRSGDILGTEPLAFAALQLGQQAQAQNALNFFAPVLFALRREQGRGGELIPVIRGLVQSQPMLVLWRTVLALTLVEGGEEAESRALFEGVMAEGPENFPLDGQWGPMMYALSETCSALGDKGAAEALAAVIQPFASTHLAGGNAVVYLGSLYACLGRLLIVCGRLGEAAVVLEKAVAAAEQMAAPLHAAHARSHLGVALAESDPARSARLIASAGEAAEALGSVRLATAVERFQAETTTRPHLPGGLSPREVEVLRLMALGQTNREIAEALVLSPNTVIRHAANIYGKIGASNRTEASHWAREHGLDR